MESAEYHVVRDVAPGEDCAEAISAGRALYYSIFDRAEAVDAGAEYYHFAEDYVQLRALPTYKREIDELELEIDSLHQQLNLMPSLLTSLEAAMHLGEASKRVLDLCYDHLKDHGEEDLPSRVAFRQQRSKTHRRAQILRALSELAASDAAFASVKGSEAAVYSLLLTVFTHRNESAHPAESAIDFELCRKAMRLYYPPSCEPWHSIGQWLVHPDTVLSGSKQRLALVAQPPSLAELGHAAAGHAAAGHAAAAAAPGGETQQPPIAPDPTDAAAASRFVAELNGPP